MEYKQAPIKKCYFTLYLHCFRSSHIFCFVFFSHRSLSLIVNPRLYCYTFSYCLGVCCTCFFVCLYITLNVKRILHLNHLRVVFVYESKAYRTAIIPSFCSRCDWEEYRCQLQAHKSHGHHLNHPHHSCLLILQFKKFLSYTKLMRLTSKAT